MPSRAQMGSKVVPEIFKMGVSRRPKGVIIEANDDDTFLDPAGSPYGSVGNPFGSHVGSNVVQISPKWVCLGARRLQRHAGGKKISFNGLQKNLFGVSAGIIKML